MELKYIDWNLIQIPVSALLSLHDPSVRKLEIAVRMKDCQARHTQSSDLSSLAIGSTSDTAFLRDRYGEISNIPLY